MAKRCFLRQEIPSKAWTIREKNEMDLARVKMRHAVYYQEQLYKINADYIGGVQNQQRALAAFDLEWPNIQLAQSWASSQAMHDSQAAALTVAFGRNAADILLLRLPQTSSVAWMEAAVEAARGNQDEDAEYKILSHLGISYWNGGFPDQAMECLERALDMARVRGDREDQLKISDNLLSYSVRQGKAKALLESEIAQCLQIAQDEEDGLREASLLTIRGMLYMRENELAAAQEDFVAALELYRRNNNARYAAVSLGNLGVAYGRAGELEKSTACLKEQLGLVREMKDTLNEINVLGNLANVRAEFGDLDQALEFAKKALSVAVSNDYFLVEPELRINLGHVRTLRKEPDEALKSYNDAIAACQSSHNPIMLGLAHRNVSLVLAELGQARLAIEHLREAKSIYQRLDLPGLHEIESVLATWQGIWKSQNSFQSLRIR